MTKTLYLRYLTLTTRNKIISLLKISPVSLKTIHESEKNHNKPDETALKFEYKEKDFSPLIIVWYEKLLLEILYCYWLSFYPGHSHTRRYSVKINSVAIDTSF